MRIYEILLKIILYVSPVIFIVGFKYKNHDDSGFCRYSDCDGFGIYTMLITGILFFFSMILIARLKAYKVYQSWRTFTLFFLPVAALSIAVSPEYDSSFVSFSDRETTTWVFVTLFFFISVVLIIYKSIKLHFLETKSGQR